MKLRDRIKHLTLRLIDYVPTYFEARLFVDFDQPQSTNAKQPQDEPAQSGMRSGRTAESV